MLASLGSDPLAGRLQLMNNEAASLILPHISRGGPSLGLSSQQMSLIEQHSHAHGNHRICNDVSHEAGCGTARRTNGCKDHMLLWSCLASQANNTMQSVRIDRNGHLLRASGGLAQLLFSIFCRFAHPKIEVKPRQLQRCDDAIFATHCQIQRTVLASATYRFRIDKPSERLLAAANHKQVRIRRRAGYRNQA
jgi:hypothetical protein